MALPLKGNCLELNLSFFSQVGLPGFDSMPSALNVLSKHERASYCNHYWENQFKKVCGCETFVAWFSLFI